MGNGVAGEAGFIGGGMLNRVESDAPYGTIGGGHSNTIAGAYAVVSGGEDNRVEIFASHASIAGGAGNLILSNAYASSISSGQGNTIGENAWHSAICSGYLNRVETFHGFIGGGYDNTIERGGGYSMIGLGQSMLIASNAHHCFIGGGERNDIQEGARYSTIGGGRNNVIQPNAFYATIGGGSNNLIAVEAAHAVIPGGRNNTAAGRSSFAAGHRAKALHPGSLVWADGQEADFASERTNQFRLRASGGVSVVAGSAGLDPAACRIDCETPNGVGLHVQQTSTDTVALLSNRGSGDQLKGYNNTGLVFRVDNDGDVTAQSFNGVGSGLKDLDASQVTSGTLDDAQLSDNVARLNSSPTFTGTATSGGDLRAGRLWGGLLHHLSGALSSIGGGLSNTNQGSHSSVGGGQGNTIPATGAWAWIGGGQNNSSSRDWATVGGGFNNRAENQAATVGGGYNNAASGNSAVVPGGADNVASGNYSFAGGRFARATHVASVVFSGGETTDSWGDRTFTARAHGGARFYSASGTGVGVELAAGGNSWSGVSDRALKENVAAVDAREMLERVAALPVTTWNLKSQPETVRHIGPMAQDFHGLFGLGEDDRHISSSDADGVALAAIQGLNQRLEELAGAVRRGEAENAALRRQVTDLANEVERLNRLVNGAQ